MSAFNRYGRLEIQQPGYAVSLSELPGEVFSEVFAIIWRHVILVEPIVQMLKT